MKRFWSGVRARWIVVVTFVWIVWVTSVLVDMHREVNKMQLSVSAVETQVSPGYREYTRSPVSLYTRVRNLETKVDDMVEEMR